MDSILSRAKDYLFGVNEVEEIRAASPGVLPPARTVYGDITPESATQIGTVYRAVDLLSTTVSQLDLKVYRDGIEIKSPSLIKSPTIDEPASAFVQETVWSLATWGNAYWRTYGNPVVNIEVLDPNRVHVAVEGGKKVIYLDGKRTNQVRHLKLQRKPGALLGVGPVQCAQEELRFALQLQAFRTSWFDTSGVPTGVLTTPETLNAQQAADFAEAWNAFLKQHGGTMVLSNGLAYEALNIKPAEAQFKEVVDSMNVAIARLWGIPAMHMLVEVGGTSTTYTNLQQSNLLFQQNTLIRYMGEVENNLTALVPRGQVVRFDQDELLRMDLQTKWKVIQTQAELGYTSGAELRALEGKAPLPNPNPTVEEGNTND